MSRAWASRIGKVGTGVRAGIAAGLAVGLMVAGGGHDDVTVHHTGTEAAAAPTGDSTTTTAQPTGTTDGPTTARSAGGQVGGSSASGTPTTVTTRSTTTTTGSPTATTSGPDTTDVPSGEVRTVGDPSTTNTQRPVAVTNLTATGDPWTVPDHLPSCSTPPGSVPGWGVSDAIVVRWSPVCGVSYRVSFDGRTLSTTSGAVVATGLAADTSYTFTVTPFTGAGDGPSSTVTARTKVDNAPKLLNVSFDEEADRILLRATTGAGGKAVSFDLVSDAGGSTGCTLTDGQDCWIAKSSLPPGPWHLSDVTVTGPYGRSATYDPDGRVGFSNCSGPWRHSFDLASIRGTI